MPNAPADSAREQFQCVSGIANPALADQYLKAEGYDVERALDSYFSGPQAAGAEGAGLAGRPQAPDGWPPPAKPPENAPSASPYPQAYPPPMPHYGPPHAPPFSAPYPPIPPYGAPPASPFPPPVPHAPPYPAPYPPPLPPYGASPAPPYPAPYPPPTPPYKAPHAPPYSASHPYPPPAPPYGAQPPAGGMPPPAPYASPPWGAHPVNTLPPLAKDVLSAQFLMIKRPVEWANLLTLGMLENANKYKVFDPNGKYVARIVEHHEGITHDVKRHLLGNHRGFCSSMLTAEGSQVIFRVRRPAYVFKSEMYIEDGGGRVLGMVRQQFNWDPKKWRKHDIFLMGRHLGTLSDSNYSDNFKLKDPHGGVLAMVYRKWQGVGKEFFTDAGKYVVHFGQPLSLDSCKPQPPVPSDLDVARPLDLLERVAMLAAVISIDFLHFSTSSEPWFKYGPSIVFPP